MGPEGNVIVADTGEADHLDAMETSGGNTGAVESKVCGTPHEQ